MKIKQISARVFYNSKHKNNTVYVKINDSTDELVFSFASNETHEASVSTAVRSKANKLPITGIQAYLDNDGSKWILGITTDSGSEDHKVVLIPTEDHDGLVGTGTLGISIDFDAWMEQSAPVNKAPVLRKMLSGLKD